VSLFPQASARQREANRNLQRRLGLFENTRHKAVGTSRHFLSSQTGRTTDTKEADHDRQYYSGTKSDRRRSVDHQRLHGSGQRPAFGNNGL